MSRLILTWLGNCLGLLIAAALVPLWATGTTGVRCCSRGRSSGSSTWRSRRGEGAGEDRAAPTVVWDEPLERPAARQYRYRDSNPGFRHERAAS
jgi:hypothetical protein